MLTNTKKGVWKWPQIGGRGHSTRNNFQITQAIGTKLGVILSHYEPLLHNKYQLSRQFMKGAFGGMKKGTKLRKNW